MQFKKKILLCDSSSWSPMELAVTQIVLYMEGHGHCRVGAVYLMIYGPTGEKQVFLQ